MTEGRILLVVPDPKLSASAARNLRERGHTLFVHSDVASARQGLRAAACQLLVIDHALMTAGGADLIDEFLAHDAPRAAILLGEIPHPAVAVRAMRSGVGDFLFKPIEPEALAESVARAMRGLRRGTGASELHRSNRELQAEKRYLQRERNQLRRRTRELNFLNELSSQIGTTLELNGLFEIVANRLRDVVRHDLLCIFQYGDEVVRACFQAESPTSTAIVDTILHDFMDHSVERAGRRVDADEVVFEIKGDVRFGSTTGDNGYLLRPELNVQEPLAVAGEPVGSLLVTRFSQDPFEPDQIRLLRTVANQLALSLRNVREYQRLQDLALRDPLTRLHNQRSFLGTLEREFDMFERYHRPVSLILLDLDDFKRINDVYGHPVGDDVLRKLGHILQSSIRKSDLAARYGGEEFVILLPDTRTDRAATLAERIRERIARAHFGPDDELRVTVSLGISSSLVQTVTGPLALVESADQCLYEAKRNGKNRVVMSEEDEADDGSEPDGSLAATTRVPGSL